MSISWKSAHPKTATPKESEVFYWPSPKFSTLVEVDLLKSAWNSLVDESKGRPLNVDARAYRWFDAICSILRNDKDKDIVRFENPSEPPSDAQWLELVERIGKLTVDTANNTSSPASKWIVDVGIVIAIRIGISEHIANVFERNVLLNKFWQESAAIQEIRNSRTGSRDWHSYASEYFPEHWPPVLASQQEPA
ncbi:hypothetical protein OV207_07390 [Corallococcus sp. BB11-1]|uniref:hypothetical protein n=1 Tax=Corallococcus sp. BB11-1 TaxID=2996783 RepID=UPI002271FF78|nr:hypothetical protein [Corallococcus sp. BB11-1]MCY1031276.1 hypothetical protein [Corallococcus sp. BB11-1]